MAQRVQIMLVDDIDGTEATETVSFSFDGVDYEIDLTAANAKKLRSDLGSVREWARENGHQVSDRGRISAGILAAYDQAHG